MIESLEAVKSAGPGGGVDESGGGEISCGVQAGRREGRRREVSVHWCVECAGYCTAASAPGSVGRGWPCTREGKVRGRFRGSARIVEET